MQKRPLISLRRALASLFRWMTAAIWLLLRAILIGWAALAIYYSNLPWWELRLGLAVAFTAFAIWVFWVSRRPLMYAAFAALFLGTLAWWLSGNNILDGGFGSDTITGYGGDNSFVFATRLVPLTSTPSPTSTLPPIRSGWRTRSSRRSSGTGTLTAASSSPIPAASRPTAPTASSTRPTRASCFTTATAMPPAARCSSDFSRRACAHQCGLLHHLNWRHAQKPMATGRGLGRELGAESLSRRAHSERRGYKSHCRRGGERRRKRRIRYAPIDVRPRIGSAASLGDGLANVTLQRLGPRLAAAGEKHSERNKQARDDGPFLALPRIFI